MLLGDITIEIGVCVCICEGIIRSALFAMLVVVFVGEAVEAMVAVVQYEVAGESEYGPTPV